MRRVLLALASAVMLVACAPSSLIPPQRSVSIQQAASALQLDFVQSEHLPFEQATAFLNHSQNYADQVSRRRQLPIFALSEQAFGLRFSFGEEQAFVMSYLGTPPGQSDVNVELRLLVGNNTQLNLNYSGPLTQNVQNVQALPLESTEQSPQTDVLMTRPTQVKFELILGLPGQGVTEAYGRYLERLGQSLRQRYGARPFDWNDAPLVYAVQRGESLLGFLFMNQRSELVLGERKYADLQNIAFVSPEREWLGGYTLLGFNPKTDAQGQLISPRVESDSPFGPIIVLGEL